MENLIIRAITQNERAKDRFVVYYNDGSYLSVDEHEVSRRKNLKLTDQVRLLRALYQGCFLDVNEKMINFFDLPSSVQSEVIISTRKAEKQSYEMKQPDEQTNQQIVEEITILEKELLKRVKQKNNSDECNCSHSEKYDFTSILSSEDQTVLCLNCGGSIEIRQN